MRGCPLLVLLFACSTPEPPAERSEPLPTPPAEPQTTPEEAPPPPPAPRTRTEPRKPLWLVEARALVETTGKPPKDELDRPVWSVQLRDDMAEFAFGRGHPEFCGDCAEIYFEGPKRFPAGVPVTLSTDASDAWSCESTPFPQACADQPVVLTRMNDLQFELQVCGETLQMLAGAHAGTFTVLAQRQRWMDAQRTAPWPTDSGWDGSDCTYAWVDCDADRPALVCGDRGEQWAREAHDWVRVQDSGIMCACSSRIPPGVTLVHP